MESRPEVKPNELLKDVFFSPRDAYESLENNYFAIFKIYSIHFQLWVLGVFGKLIHNLIVVFIIHKFWPYEEPPKIQDGLFLFGVMYPMLVLFFHLLDLISFHISEGKNESNVRVFFLYSLIFSSSSLFWLFPKSIAFIFIIYSLYLTFKFSFIALNTQRNFNRDNFFKLFLTLGIFGLTCTAIFLSIARAIRG